MIENRGSHPNSRANLIYRIPKGSTPWNKGKGWAEFTCPNCSKTNTFLISQVKRGFCNKTCYDQYQTHSKPQTYSTLHAWVRRNFGTPNKCDECGTTSSKKFEWANISGEYLQDKDDWVRLCCKCHRQYDFGTKNKLELTCV